MKITAILIATTALLTEHVVSAAGGYLGSCQSWSISGNLLTATCTKTGGGTRTTRQDMNLCIGNSNGALVAQDKYEIPSLSFHSHLVAVANSR